MIMEMAKIKEVVENAQFGDEVTIHVRDSDLNKGIPVPINSAKMKIVIHDTLLINLELHEYEIVGNLDKYTLFSTDESKEYREELVVHDKWKLYRWKVLHWIWRTEEKFKLYINFELS